MIVWLTSYPKSGNTWVRAFLSAYLHSPNGNFNFNLLDKIEEFPQHDLLNQFMNKKNFHSLKEISKYWIKAQEVINLNNKITFLKTHSALCNINGNFFTTNNSSLICIYIVRDPRNVILSLSNHFGKTQEESYKILTDERYIIYPRVSSELFPATHIASWKTHYLSWKNSNTKNKIIIKYEDLINDSKNTFKKILNFLNEHANIKYDENRFINSINTTQFEDFKKYEEKYGFDKGQKDKFFHLGKRNDWKSLLDTKISSKIMNEFKFEMNELGYI